MSTNYSYLFKFIVIGNSNVGKSCLLLQFTDQEFKDEHDITIGVEFGCKYIKEEQKTIKLQIWDTAGQENFRSVIRGYYRSAIGILLVYDITNKQSFHSLTQWIEDIQQNGKDNVSIMIVGNKMDQENERQISFQDGYNFAEQNKFMFMETSAKNGNNVDECFIKLTKTILNRLNSGVIKINEQEQGVRVGDLYIENKRNSIKINKIQQEKQIIRKQKCC